MEVLGRWDGIQKLLTRSSPLAHPDFEPSEEVMREIHGIGVCIYDDYWLMFLFRPCNS